MLLQWEIIACDFPQVLEFIAHIPDGFIVSFQELWKPCDCIGTLAGLGLIHMRQHIGKMGKYVLGVLH